MNRTYRLVWSRRVGGLVAVSEATRGQGKQGRKAGAAAAVLLAGVLLASGAQAQSIAANTLPSGAQVTAGAATVSQSGNTMNIDQSTQRAAINWQSFSVGRDAAVNFNQPNSSAITLNRVVGNERSVIDGAIRANGNVWILNSAGVLFNNSARVDVGGLVASTLNISDADFMAGRTTFESDGTRGSVINLGTLTAADGGHIALLGNQVSNQGVISARLGSAMLAAGDKISLNFNGNSLVGVTIDRGTLDGLVENKQAIYADGGRVLLSTQALDTVLNGLVNNSGLIQANGIGNGQNGEVILYAHGGTVEVGGNIQAEGGFVETSGKAFAIQPGAVVQAANWLIDPVNIVIDSVLAGTISSALGVGNVTVSTAGGNTPSTASGESGTDGDITVNSAISWATNRMLTLRADRNIHIYAPITASAIHGELTLEYGQAAVAAGNTATYDFGLGATGFLGKVNLQEELNFHTKLGSDGTTVDYTVINTASTLQSIASNSGWYNLGGNYALGSDIDLSGIPNWTPLGAPGSTFNGKLEGLGHTLDHLTVNWLYPGPGAGFFGYTDSATIRNFGLTNVSVTSNANSVGALVGDDYNSTISGIYISGNVSGNNNVGGLAGNIYLSNISDVYASGTVTGQRYVGGLVGYNYSAQISDVYVSGVVTANRYVGGLVGYNSYSSISRAHTAGSVTATGGDYAGGLIGYDDSSAILQYAITDSYSNADVTGNSYVGGLVGYGGSSYLVNDYATGNVSSSGEYVGGLVGYGYYGYYNRVFATGNVVSTYMGDATIGGLIGYAYLYELNDAYATGSVTGENYVGGLIGFLSGINAMNRVYATGSVSATASSGTVFVGGLLGAAYYGSSSSPYQWVNAYDSYWNPSTTGQSGAWTWYSGAPFGQSVASVPGIVESKTTAELQSLATYGAWGANIVADSNLPSGSYPQLRFATSGAIPGSSIWVIGTGGSGGGSDGASSGASATVTGLPVPQDQAVEQIRSATQALTYVPPTTLPLAPTSGVQAPGASTAVSNVVTTPPAIQTALSGSDNLLVLTAPRPQEATAAVSLSEARNMLGKTEGNGEGGSDGEREVRVPVSRNSLAEIVNGGLRLPDGVEQQLFVVKN